MHDENPFHHSVLLLPIEEFPGKPITPPSETQQYALDDITQQLVEYLTLAVQARDPFRAIKIIVNAEKILGVYTSQGFNMLAGFQQQLQSDLHIFWRMMRRRFIRAALLSTREEYPLFLADMRNPKLGLDSPDAIADFRAVERHLDEHQPLFDDLHKQTAQN